MISSILVIILFTLLLIFFIIKFNSRKKLKSVTLIERFKNKFKNKNHVRIKLSERMSDSLMNDPEINIRISTWYNEFEIREKADIHRARLSKYGKSKMNGEMLFLGPKGGVYKYGSDGKKKYL